MLLKICIQSSVQVMAIVYTVTSSKRIEVLKEYMEYCNSDVKKVLKYTNARWLSLMKTMHRNLELYEGLNPYFVSHVEAEGDKKNAKVEKLAKQFEDPKSKIYMLFRHSCLPTFDNFIFFTRNRGTGALQDGLNH